MLWRILLALLISTCCNSLITSRFHKDILCDLQMRLDRGCSEEVPQINNLLECLSHCGQRDSCIGASVDTDTNKCYIHQACTPDIPCDVLESQHKCYSSFCVYGLWNINTGSCDCFHGCSGDRCDKVIEICGDLITAGYEQGDYRTYIDPGQDGNVLKVICSIHPPTYWNVRMIVNTGKLNCNRTWNEYLDGFYIDEENFFGGLRAWHILSNDYNHDNMVAGLSFNGGTNVYGDYVGFVVNNDEQKYSFTYSYAHSYSNGAPPGPYTFGDCFSSIQNIPFSTWDKNNDGDDCASLVGSGWWHPPQCDLPCNLLGWGLDDWYNVPVQQRLSVLGDDMDYAVSQSHVYQSFLYIIPL